MWKVQRVPKNKKMVHNKYRIIYQECFLCKQYIYRYIFLFSLHWISEGKWFFHFKLDFNSILKCLYCKFTAHMLLPKSKEKNHLNYYFHYIIFSIRVLKLLRMFYLYFSNFKMFHLNLNFLKIVSVRAWNETVGFNLTWAHNLFIGWALGFPTLGRSRHRNSE